METTIGNRETQKNQTNQYFVYISSTVNVDGDQNYKIFSQSWTTLLYMYRNYMQYSHYNSIDL